MARRLIKLEKSEKYSLVDFLNLFRFLKSVFKKLSSIKSQRNTNHHNWENQKNIVLLTF